MDKENVLGRSIPGAMLGSACGLAVWVLTAYLFGYSVDDRYIDLPRTGILLCGILAGGGAIVFVGERGIRMVLVTVCVAIPMLTAGGLLASYADWHSPRTRTELAAIRQKIVNSDLPSGPIVPLDLPMVGPTTERDVFDMIRERQLQKFDQMTYIEFYENQMPTLFWELAIFAAAGVLFGGLIAYAPFGRTEN
jgi:hypothetical protein